MWPGPVREAKQSNQLLMRAAEERVPTDPRSGIVLVGPEEFELSTY